MLGPVRASSNARKITIREMCVRPSIVINAGETRDRTKPKIFKHDLGSSFLVQALSSSLLG